MSEFVLDNSVAMRWLLCSEKAADQRYADAVLGSLIEATAWVPALWHLEAANVLLCAERRGELDIAEIERFSAQLENLPIAIDAQTATHALGRTLVLARSYGLSSYDAAYLELAVRQGLPLASLDKALLKAAARAGVARYQPAA